MEAYRIKKYIGSYYAALGHVDAVIFTAGVGEMNPSYRLKSLKGLENMGIILDEKKTASLYPEIVRPVYLRIILR